MRRIANRKEEFRLFERMLRNETTFRILMIEGPSELGKSTLLSEYTELAIQILGPRRCACADLKGGSTLGELLFQFYRELGKDVLLGYANYNAHPTGQMNVEVSLQDARLGNQNNVAVQPVMIAPVDTSPERNGERVIEDLLAVTRPVVLILDTFNDATKDAARWIEQQLLAVVRQNSHIKIVVAGKHVPQKQLSWGRWAHRHNLTPVTDVEDWHEFACSFHPAFPRKCIEDVCNIGRALFNRPSVIREIIELKLQELPPHTREEGQAR